MNFLSPRRLRALAAALGLALAPAAVSAQKALVYCPVGIDETGCNTIVAALNSVFTAGIDRGYDGTAGTVDLATVDLAQYSVLLIPSLADDNVSQPYARLRDAAIAARVRAALLGRVALWSGTPDQGSTNRTDKDILIRNLANLAAANFAAVNGPGLVALQDHSATTSARYNWVSGLTGFSLTADAALQVYSSVRTLTPVGTQVLDNGGSQLAYTNMASLGFQLPSGAAGVALDAVGQTGTSVGGQVVLVTSAGSGGPAQVWTDKDDYVPHEAVGIWGSGWHSGEIITITLTEDPAIHTQRSFNVTVDATGAFFDESFVPEDHHAGVRFVLTAVGQTSGRQAQTTFTDAIATGASSTNANTGNGIGSRQLTISAPAVLVNDVLIAQIVITDAVSNVFICPLSAGWTSIRKNNSSSNSVLQETFWFRASAAAGATSYTWEFRTTSCAGPQIANNTKAAAGGIIRYAGVITSGSPVDTAGTNAGTSSGPFVAPSVTTNTANAQIIRFFGAFKNTDISDVVTPRIYWVGSLARTEKAAAAFNGGPKAAPGATGADTVTFASSAEFVSQTVALKEHVVNVAPVSVDDAYSTNEDTPLVVAAPGVLANDTDANGNTLTATRPAGSTGPSNGTLTLNANGSFTYTPNADFHGSDSFTYKAHDGTVASASFATVTITINAVNDAPSFVSGGDKTVNEDAGAQTFVGWATAISAGPANESGQTLTFTTTNDNNALFSVQPSVASNGTLTLTPAPNEFGWAVVTVTLQDNGGTANGGVDTFVQTFTITVDPVNDAPSFTKGADQAVAEDAGAQSVPGWATAISTGPANEALQTVSFIVTNNTNPSLFSAAPAVSSSGALTYTPAADAFGTATITLKAKDDGGTANGGVDESATQSFVITVTSVNDPPTFTLIAGHTSNEDAGAQSVPSALTAASAGPANEPQALTLAISNDNNALFSVQPAIDLTTGVLTYTAALNGFGTANVTVRLTDTETAFAEHTLVITVNAVNDAPSFTKGADQTVLEDSGPASVSGWATGISSGPANESGQTVSFMITGNTNPGLFSAAPAVSSSGTLTYTPAANANGTATITLKAKDDGGTLNGGVDESATQSFVIDVTPVNDAPTFIKGANQTVLEDAAAQTITAWATNISAGPADEAGQTLTFSTTNTDNTLFSVQPAVALDGTLTYTPAANAFGSATVTVKLMDNGGTANGGVDFTEQTFTITITPVNDAPSFTKGADQTVLEDSGPATVSGWATAISSGPANESTQTVSFIITGNTNPGLFSAAPAVSSSGTLTYTPAANANGTATITLKAKDDGGTLNGGVDESATQSFVIDVTPVNDAPTFIKGANQTVLEDAPAQTVPDWATSISAGPADEAGQTLTFSTTNTDNTLFSVQPAVALDGTLTYTPAANRFGTATVTVALKDNGGTANGGQDTSADQTFTIDITPVNDAPSFTKGADQTVLEDSGAKTVSPWATAISAGPFETQTVSFVIVSNTNPSLFSAAPAVASDGTLTFTPATNANGTATIEVKITDDGGTANDGVDESATQSFVINVTPVNDAPSFTKGADQTVLEDATAQSVSNWATNISAGPADEAAQTLTFQVTNNNNVLFSVQPAINASGTLTYTPAANRFGTATVTVNLTDNGGILDGGQDTSADQTFTITITPVNDAPSFTKGADQTVLEDSGAKTVSDWATGISAGPFETQNVTFEIVSNTYPTLFSAAPAVASDGTLTFTPAVNANGTATITLKAKDDGGTANGVDESATQSFVINVTPVNDAPTYDLIGNQTVAEDAGPQTVPNAVTNKSAGPADESGQTLTLSVSGTNAGSLFSNAPAIDASGTLTYTPAPNANGSSTVTVTLKDNGGTANGGVDQTVKTFTITVTPVNDDPVITALTAGPSPAQVNTTTTLSATFTDADLGDVPNLETHTATINWGDGTPVTAGTISGSSGTSRSVAGSHTYTGAGVYTVTLTVRDGSNATDVEIFQYVVIYDPSAGFVTGGGWINSPLDAYTANPSLTGKANFGFVAKYKKGATAPEGNAEFQFHAGDLNFHSTTYQYLVVAGAKGIFKGEGKVNGVLGFGFLISAVDGQLNGGGGADKFRIKIWRLSDESIVYDNLMSAGDDATPTTVLGGGSIVIHAK